MVMHRHRVLQGNTNRNSNFVFTRLRSIDNIKPSRMLTVLRKFAILEEAEQTGCMKISTHKHKLPKTQIMNWSVNKEKLIENSNSPMRHKRSIETP